MIGAVSVALLLAAATHDVSTTPSNTYSPAGLRVASGDTVRWQASDVHPLVFDGRPGGPYTSMQERQLTGASQLRFHCDVHGGSGCPAS